MEGIKKIVLAYSGGLDTSVILKWLQERYGAEVIAFTADLGQGDDLERIREKAVRIGASKVYVEDLREEFVYKYVFPALKAGAVYESKYMLATALGRPLIAKKLVEIAEEEDADAVAHGCTGKGNDQVRFEVTVSALNPDLKVLAPVREWEMGSREEEIEYALERGIPVDATKKSPYSVDLNLWGRSIECGVLEDPWIEPPEEVYKLTVSPEAAPDKPTYVEVDFHEGVPIALNGREMNGVELIEKLNEIAGKNGVGRVDLVENRLVGIKSREIYECPAATVLFTALRGLEELTIDRETRHFKGMLSERYAELVYYGLWHHPLREAIDSFMSSIHRGTTGTVRLKLYKGNCILVGRRSPNSLYDYSLATYDRGDMFDHKAANGFIKLWGLPLKIKAMVDSRSKKNL
ncbi:argininosuccinate synthase [Candidatus Poribacteria bacterium]|nr:argininosuccinate synthase [Candidatus Poribacteria bacterium]